MASDALHYTDLTPAPQLDKATLNKMVWRSLNLQASFNYERMQAAGWHQQGRSFQVHDAQP